jgi:SAM-dependent methyltransferase
MIVEELPQMARALFDLALSNCGACCDYHATWGFLRAAGLRRGAVADFESLSAEFSGLRAKPRILITGCADTGQLTLVANSLAGSSPSITLVDRCATPLRLCAGFARQNGIDLEIRQGSVEELQDVGRYDAIFSHEFLGFVDEGKHLALLNVLNRALVPNGRVIIAQRVHEGEQRAGLGQSPEELAVAALAKLRDKGIALPEAETDFARRIVSELGGARRQRRNGAFRRPGDIERLLTAAGFGAVSTRPIVLAPDKQQLLLQFRPWMSRYAFVAHAETQTGNSR